MKRQQAEEKKQPLIIKPHHERILEVVFRYHFVTAEQVTRLLYRPGSASKVRALLFQLETARYLLSLYLPRATPFGAVPKIYTLNRKGINLLKSQGYDVPTRFHPSDEVEKSYLFLRHALSVNDFLIAAATLSKTFPAITVHDFKHERVLKREEPIKVSIEKFTQEGKRITDASGQPMKETMRLIPDAFLDMRLAQPDREKTYRFCLLLELDRATIGEVNFKRKVRGLLAFAKIEQECLKRFGTKLVTIAFANAVGGERRRDHMKHWTEAELKKSKETNYWAQLFVFTALPEAINAEALFLSPVWYTPFRDRPTVLVSAGSR